MQTFDEIKQNSQVIYPHSLLLLVTTMKMLKIVLLVTIFLPWNEDSTEDVICGEMCISMRSEEIVGLEWREISLYSVIWSEDGDHYIITGNFLSTSPLLDSTTDISGQAGVCMKNHENSSKYRPLGQFPLCIGHWQLVSGGPRWRNRIILAKCSYLRNW